jgi:hypothetical protein
MCAATRRQPRGSEKESQKFFGAERLRTSADARPERRGHPRAAAAGRKHCRSCSRSRSPQPSAFATVTPTATATLATSPAARHRDQCAPPLAHTAPGSPTPTTSSLASTPVLRTPLYLPIRSQFPTLVPLPFQASRPSAPPLLACNDQPHARRGLSVDLPSIAERVRGSRGHLEAASRRQLGSHFQVPG